MKEKIKNFIMYGSITLYIVIIILVISNYFVLKNDDKINLTKNEKYQEELNKYKEEVKLINNNSCKEYINKYIDSYEKTDYANFSSKKEAYNTIYNQDYEVGIMSVLNKDNPCYYSEEFKEESNVTYYGINKLMFNNAFFAGGYRLKDNKYILTLFTNF